MQAVSFQPKRVLLNSGSRGVGSGFSSVIGVNDEAELDVTSLVKVPGTNYQICPSEDGYPFDFESGRYTPQQLFNQGAPLFVIVGWIGSWADGYTLCLMFLPDGTWKVLGRIQGDGGLYVPLMDYRFFLCVDRDYNVTARYSDIFYCLRENDYSELLLDETPERFALLRQAALSAALRECPFLGGLRLTYGGLLGLQESNVVPVNQGLPYVDTIAYSPDSFDGDIAPVLDPTEIGVVPAGQNFILPVSASAIDGSDGKYKLIGQTLRVAIPSEEEQLPEDCIQVCCADGTNEKPLSVWAVDPDNLQDCKQVLLGDGGLTSLQNALNALAASSGVYHTANGLASWSESIYKVIGTFGDVRRNLIGYLPAE